jgi:hypothetical protein
LIALSATLSLIVAAGCATSTAHGGLTFPGSDAAGGQDGTGPEEGGTVVPLGGSDDGGFTFPTGPKSDGGVPEGGFTDFPATPVTDDAGAPSSANFAELFAGDGGTDTTTDAPCLSEPSDGALYPYNWLRPRLYWAAPPSQKVFEVRVSSPAEANDYVVYTTNHYWALDKTTWQKVAGVEGGAKGTLVGQTLTFVVRGSSGSGPAAISNRATIQIAPAIADGSLIFWSTASFAAASASTDLQGFRVGDEGTTPALTVPQVQQQVWAGPPDGALRGRSRRRRHGQHQDVRADLSVEPG